MPAERVVAVDLGGTSLKGAGESLFDPLAERLEALVRFAEVPAAVPAALGPDTGLRGAAIAACQALGVSGHPVLSSAAR